MIDKTASFYKKYERQLKNVIIALLSVLALISVAKGVINGLDHPVDFIYGSFRKIIFQRTYDNVYFPFTIWPLVLIGLLPEAAARAVWVICNLILTGLMVWLLRRTLFQKLLFQDYLILMLMMLAGGPWRTNLSNGQYNLWCITFFLLALYFSEKDNDILAGFFLSLCMIKFQVTGPLAVYFFYKRKYKVIGITGIFMVLYIILSSIWLGGFYNVTLKVLQTSSGLGNMGDVDIESLLGLGDYTMWIYLSGIIFLMCVSYFVKWDKDDVLFISVCFFSAWFFSYQRIYSFFTLIISLGYTWLRLYACDNKRRWFYIIESALTFLLMLVFFWGRTVSDKWGVIIARSLYYPVFLVFLFDLFCLHRTENGN